MLRPWKLDLKVNERSTQFPIYIQIAQTIIKAIESGVLKSGNALPGTRKLALLFNVSRTTIIEAYNYLEVEGWLVSSHRTGTFVSDTLPKHKKKEYIPNSNDFQPNEIVFDQGLPDARHSPILDIMREYRKIARKIPSQRALTEGDPRGHIKLRKVLSHMLNQQRRIIADENNICITRGSQMGIFLISQCLLNTGDCIIVEHPGYRLAWKAFEYAGASILLAEVDKNGILVSNIKKYIKLGRKIKAIYISPNCQFPTTSILSDRRRKALIDLSNQYGFFIIEDDYCIDLNYTNKPFFPVCQEKSIDNYIYIGTFSRSISPLLKIGYLVGNHDFIKKVANLRKIIDINGDVLMEGALVNLIQDGIFSRHIKKAIDFYRAKRDFVKDLLDKYLKDKIVYTVPDLGLGYWIVPNKPINYHILLKELRIRNIKMISLNYYKIESPGFYLSFGSIEEEKLEKGIQILANYM